MNVQSLGSQIYKLRASLLDVSLAAPTIIALVETQIPHQSRMDLSLSGYEFIYIPSEPANNQPRAPGHARGTPGGGVIVY